MIFTVLVCIAKVAGSIVVLALFGLITWAAFFRKSHAQQELSKNIRDRQCQQWFDELDREGAEDELALEGKPITDENVEQWLKDWAHPSLSSPP